ncbi:MAG: protein kinase family protein [Candidatus Cloacimonetes bacterium]|jgi:serine/threonine-protein kinase|nr:protein kinase family protein [Candidatus Cloacimonadota bacterium]MCK9334967.1 protein kinase family protein [Candidatus Cloacimonadota bacterium]MDD4034012.1 protein kinase family protein [Candidatus Cloacimonadota bacterium]
MQEIVPSQQAKQCVFPSEGEVITSLLTNNTYEIGSKIGEGNFSHVYACTDVWDNDLAVKVLKPLGSYEYVKDNAVEEFQKLVLLRHPNVTYVYDAFEYRNTFYIVTERCYGSLDGLFSLDGLEGMLWLRPIARCILQAVHYLHVNQFVHQDIHVGNIFTKFVKDEMNDANPDVIQFKLGDLGVGKFITDVSVGNVRAQWMLPPEIMNPDEFGPIDHRIDLYHLGLVFLQLALSTKLSFTPEDILAGKPRQMALELPQPLSFAIEKTLRRHVMYRTESVLELWRDLNTRM